MFFWVKMHQMSTLIMFCLVDLFRTFYDTKLSPSDLLSEDSWEKGMWHKMSSFIRNESNLVIQRSKIFPYRAILRTTCPYFPRVTTPPIQKYVDVGTFTNVLIRS